MEISKFGRLFLIVTYPIAMFVAWAVSTDSKDFKKMRKHFNLLIKTGKSDIMNKIG